MKESYRMKGKTLRMNEKKVTNEKKLRMCGDSRIWCGYYLVIRDVLSYVLGDVRFVSNQVRECVCFWLTQYEQCQLCSEPTGVEQLLLSAVGLVQEAIGTSGACCGCSFPCCQLIFCTRPCVHDSRHAAFYGSSGNTVTCFGEPSETDGGSVGYGTTGKSSNC